MLLNLLIKFLLIFCCNLLAISGFKYHRDWIDLDWIFVALIFGVS